MSNSGIHLTEAQYQRLLHALETPDDHLSSEQIRAYVQLHVSDAEERDAVETHLFECEECLSEYNRLFEAISPLKSAFEEARLRIDLKTAQKTTTGSQHDLWELISQGSFQALIATHCTLLLERGKAGKAISQLMNASFDIDQFIQSFNLRLTVFAQPVKGSGSRPSGPDQDEQAEIPIDPGDEAALIERYRTALLRRLEAE